MRNSKRRHGMRFALFLAVLLMLSAALTGCGKKTAIGLVTTASKKLEKVKSAQGNVIVDLVFGYDIGIAKGSIPIGTELAYEYTVEPAVAHMSGSVKVMGTETALEMYVAQEGEASVTYVKSLGYWSKKTSTAAEEAQNIEQPGAVQSLAGLLKLGSEMTLSEELGSYNGKEAYEIKLTVTGETLKQLLTASGVSLDEIIMADNVDYTKVSADVKILIDKETETFGEITLDIKGMEQFIDMSMLGMNIGSFESLTVTFGYTGFDTVDAITIPEEAKAARQMQTALKG